ncbi:MAG: sugar ABC transporter substrate-binding protein [SAR324 cluster bacterium]|nr:sugar ABC transporter substrate-binding protein [SAR324 cluster bacterium]
MKTIVIGIAIHFLVFDAVASAQTSLTIGTVNNSDMIIMQQLSKEFTRENPGIRLNWVVLEENVLRQRITADISTNAGIFDIITIGTYETPIWAERGWLTPLDEFPEEYDIEDFVEEVRKSLSFQQKLYAIPFYAEGSMTFYRKDLFQEKDLRMPEVPTYDDIYQFASTLHQPEENIYGICLRGKAGWGENMAFVTSLIHAFGGRWFDLNWKPQLTSPEWKKAISFYVNILKNFGPPGATHYGHIQNRALFANGHCAIWVDASSPAGFFSHPKKSIVSQNVGFAEAPKTDANIGSKWFWSWVLAIPSSSKAKEAAKKFILWATSKEYVELVGNREGWVLVPPGTRKSTYANPHYKAVAGNFSELTLKTIEETTPVQTKVQSIPYAGHQFVGIPEFQTIGSQVGQVLAEALVGKISVEKALEQAQHITEKIMQKAGYYPAK